MPDGEMNDKVIVSAVGLTKVFYDFWNRPKAKAVNDIDFEVKKGEVLGLLGPNGSGKSTTVKMLLGLLYPTGGRLTVFGKSPRDVDTKRLIGYLPEETYLYKYLTAFETLDFFASLFNLSKGERVKRCNQLLDMVGLSHARNRAVGEFSKGMARRIGLAQAMINDPEFLILDEPTSGLDPIGCREVKELIKTLKRRGKTVIVTSHLLSDVEDVCDRVIILYGGRIRAEGAVNDLLTIGNSETVTFPTMEDKALEKVLAVIRENLSSGDCRVEHPRMSLEDFFLDVVNKARGESLETSGAQAGGSIANYLSGETKENVPAEKVLERLSSDVAEQEKPSSADAAAEAEKAEAAKKMSSALKELERNDDAAQAKKRDAASEEAKESLASANEKLKNFFGSGDNK